MRISDWSSDVSSSDVPVHRAAEQKLLRQILRAGVDMERIENLRGSKRPPERACIAVMERRKGRGIAGIDANSAATVAIERSEEHTSELQSLMRISSAVFCLKKKKKTHTKS